MKYAILFLVLASSVNAAEYKSYYVANGKTVDNAEAFAIALKGSEVVKCQTVEARPNKKGTSITLRNVKKPAVNGN